MISRSLKYIAGFVVLLFAFVMSEKTVYAGEFDNAYQFYKNHANDDSPAFLNTADGYVYFCSWGTKSSTSTKYKTVGYTLTINYSGKTDYIEVKLGGSLIKNISTVTKDNVVYVLRRAKLTRLQELFSGNSNISWHQIFRKKNTYTFDAIMTVSEKGSDICGEVTETEGNRRLTADKPGFLYRTLAGIKGARNWKNPGDLNNFFGRSLVLEPVSPIKVGDMVIMGDNTYNYSDKWYVKKDSLFYLGFISSFDDVEAVTAKYHPNYNVFKFTGWGDNQKYYVSQGTGGKSKGKTGVLLAGSSENKPVSSQGIYFDGTTTYDYDSMNFTSWLMFNMLAPDGKSVQATPEGRVYYNNEYPAKDSDEDNLCDLQSNVNGKVSMISDGNAPVINAPTYVSSFMDADTCISVQVSDSGAGINEIKVIRNDGVIMYDKRIEEYCNYYNLYNELWIRANDTYSYYVYAIDNVGNESTSGYFRFSVPRAYTIEAKATGGYGIYNTSLIHAEVFGGNSDISSIVIMSEDYDNPSGERIVATNMSVEAHTLPAGKRQLYHEVDVMDYIRDYPDGRYMFNVISGGRYVSSTPARVAVLKDITPPIITRTNLSATPSGWHKKYVNYTLYVKDLLAGVDDIIVNSNGMAVQGNRQYEESKDREVYKFRVDKEGANQICITATDFAGNERTMKTEVKIDATEPDYTLYGGLDGSDINESGWINKSQLYGGIIVTDRLSGISLNKALGILRIRKNDSYVNMEEEDYDILQYDYEKATIRFTSAYIDNIVSSKNKLLLYLYDRAGNNCSKELYLNVDCDAPVLSYPDDEAWDAKKYKGNIIIKDPHSGISYIGVKYNGEVKKTYVYDASAEEKINLDMSEYEEDGGTVSVVMTDMVGNTSECELESDDEKKKIRAIKSIRTRIR